MKKVLITGITGFAGSFLAELLLQNNDGEVYGTYNSDRHLTNIASIRDSLHLTQLNLLDQEKIENLISEIKPDVVYHLAALTHVGKSFSEPALTITNNVTAQINLLEALRKYELLQTKVLVISSSHAYGMVKKDDLPIKEETPFNPDNPYSVSKIAQDYIGLQYFLSYKMPIVRLRPFNHIGPRQSSDISISRFAKAIAEIEKGTKEPVLKVGNLETKRDFTDVRDMARAYLMAENLGVPGQVYNIGSGKSVQIGDMLEKLLSMSKVKIQVESDESLFRPSDIEELRADATKFMNLTNWKPEIPIDTSLKDALDYWRGLV